MTSVKTNPFQLVEVTACGRCGARVSSHKATYVPAGTWESCWYCLGPLCYPCWDELGHCGHRGAEAINEASRAGGPGVRTRLSDAIAAQHEIDNTFTTYAQAGRRVN